MPSKQLKPQNKKKLEKKKQKNIKKLTITTRGRYPKKKEEEQKKQKEEEEEKNKQLKLEKNSQKNIDKHPLFNYYRQLNHLNLQNTTSGILLECLLDNIDINQNLETRNSQKEIERILQNFQNQIIFQNQNPLLNYNYENFISSETKSTQYKTIIDYNDQIEKISLNSHISNLQLASFREKNLLKNILFPGLNRQKMPIKPPLSIPERNCLKQNEFAFVSNNLTKEEFEHQKRLIFFEKMIQNAEPERSWDFSDRIYIEKHSENTLRQLLWQNLLFEPKTVTQYNPIDDNLYLCMYFKNPPGRILRNKWTQKFQTIPSLENWIKYVKDDKLNFENQTFYNLDDQKVGNIHEKIKYIYPNDNSVILGNSFQVGNQLYYRYKVLKEGVIFGIRENIYKKANFWAYFDNRSILNAEIDQNQNIDFTFTLKNGLIVKFLANGDVIQTKLEQDIINNYKDFDDIVNPYNNNKPNKEIETKRVITGKGSVIKYTKDGSIFVFFANGNVSFCQQNNGIWITTNNKGKRKIRNIYENTENELDQINVQYKFDIQTEQKIYFRDDQTLVIQEKDGSIFTQHSDGTQIYTKKDIIIIQHQDFCTVKILSDQIKSRTDTIIGIGSAYASVGFDNLFERSNDGKIIEAYLLDGTKVISYKEKKELPGFNKHQLNRIFLLYTQNGDVAKILDNGEIVFISAVDRIQLKKNSHKSINSNSNDIEYWLQLYCIPEERKTGVYSFKLQENIMWTKDDEGNYFSLKSDGEIINKIAVSLNNDNSQSRPSTPNFQDGDFIEEENKFLPIPPSWIDVKLLVIENDNTGYELFNYNQLENFFRLKQQDNLCQIIDCQQVEGFQNLSSISFINKIQQIEDQKQDFIKFQIPRIINYIPNTAKKIEIPSKQIFLHRILIKYDKIDLEKRNVFNQNQEKYFKYQLLQEQEKYKIIQKSEDEKDKQIYISLKIIEKRKKENQQNENCNNLNIKN
ncbi:hypothetical protein IMG5_051980 [Ichthyophthirius multifiliis]|uniref:Uncharacterized protein n=1 Tax=Ichthyophthirius multifiliis TaxID=5932 RepID=G0QMU7_ICHMU|nr:hypothetical protein IMG5_051980 [Ichthyophthirius multifiliis]EGR33457.1 hypothetical protein IMG5_051980 [Ichthyophthirius multifiliis]|eukprot:XP_004037443.1 hypothetical protein IMG5_051980 [Ichthyophthirius multifiliis]